MASPNLSEIITTTLRDRSGKLADNVSKGNALLNKLKSQGGWKPAEGRTIVQEVDYQANSTFMYYSGSQALNISSSDVLTAYEYNWSQAACSVVISGLERDVQNVGRAQMIDLLEGRIMNAERTMKNNITIGMYSDGTGSGGLQIGGLQLLVADDPTSGTVGGINRATWTFARNQYYRATSDGGAVASAANIQSYMDSLWLRCSRGNDQTNLILADQNYFKFFWASLQGIQRLYDADMGKLGFKAIQFNTAPVVYEDSTGMPASHMYFLNTDYLFLRYAKKRLFTPLEEVRSVNQDATVKTIVFAGQMTTSNAQLQGVLREG